MRCELYSIVPINKLNSLNASIGNREGERASGGMPAEGLTSTRDHFERGSSAGRDRLRSSKDGPSQDRVTDCPLKDNLCRLSINGQSVLPKG